LFSNRVHCAGGVLRRGGGTVSISIYHIPPTDCPYKTDIYFYNLRWRPERPAPDLRRLRKKVNGKSIAAFARRIFFGKTRREKQI
jgi:hypothetical protein